MAAEEEPGRAADRRLPENGGETVVDAADVAGPGATHLPGSGLVGAMTDARALAWSLTWTEPAR